jgi:hypothetical protein
MVVQCCKHLFKIFYLFSNVCCKCVYLDIAYICLTYMLQVFYLNVAYIFQWFFKCFQVFLQVFQTHVSCVFKHMLQIFYRNISTTDRLLLLGTHLSQQASGRGSRGGANGLRMGSKGACNVRMAQARTWARVAECRRGRPKAHVYPGRWHCHKNNQ